MWRGSSRLGCGYTSNCTGGVPHWVCHYLAPGLAEGDSFVANVKPDNGDASCTLSPSPPSPPPPIASPPPNFPPFGKEGGITDIGASISNPDEQGGRTRMAAVSISAIVLGGLLFFCLIYYCLYMRKGPVDVAMMGWHAMQDLWRYVRKLPEVSRAAVFNPNPIPNPHPHSHPHPHPHPHPQPRWGAGYQKISWGF